MKNLKKVNCYVYDCEKQSTDIPNWRHVLFSIWAGSTKWYVCSDHYDLFDEVKSTT